MGLNAFMAQFVLILGIVAAQVQDLALALVERHEVCTGPLPVKVMDAIPALKHGNLISQIGVLNPTLYLINKDTA